MIKRHSRSQALVQVLIMSLLMAILASALIKSVVHQSFLAKKAVDGAEKAGSATSVVMAVTSIWNSNQGQLCSSGSFSSGPSVNCTGTAPGTCGCSCTVTIAGTNYSVATSLINTNFCQIRSVSTY